MAVTRLIERGWPKEVDANPRWNEPLWRETDDGHGTTLVVTDAGLLAIGIEPVVVKTVVVKTVVVIQEHVFKASAPNLPTERAGTKLAMLIAMLQAPPSPISSRLKNKLGLAITTAKEKQPELGVSYRLISQRSRVDFASAGHPAIVFFHHPVGMRFLPYRYLYLTVDHARHQANLIWIEEQAEIAALCRLWQRLECCEAVKDDQFKHRVTSKGNTKIL